MLLPKRVKYRRVQRGRMTGKATRGNVVCQGQYGLVALEPAWISSKQIEAARVAMTRYIKRGGKVWIKIFPDKPVTEKPAETRMGSGKGSPEYWVAVVKPGRVMFELADVDEATAREALRLAMHKLPSAEKFESWIFDELVPETLKNGGYLLKKNGETDNELLARAILLAQNRIKERDSRISALEKENNYAILKLKLQAPKVQYYDKVLQSQSTYTTTQIAKELGMTAGMLNKRLRWAGIQFRQSGQWLLKAPYQNQGYTATRTHVWESRTGETGTAMLTVWTEKGRLFIHYLFEAYLV